MADAVPGKPTLPVNIKGEFVRASSTFRQWITADGSSGFPAESGRYHLYVSLACPWAHRTLIYRELKGLQDAISITIVDPVLDFSTGWRFTNEEPLCTLDENNNGPLLRNVYFAANPDYGGRFTVPVLWDKVQKTIVNNESSEIIRILNKEFNAFCATPEQAALDFYTKDLSNEIDELNSWIYSDVNNGVYRCGFATTQEAYDAAVQTLFEALNKLETIVSTSRYLTGKNISEADIRLFTTLIRFDLVYHGHFKCNKKMLKEFTNIWAYTRDLYQTGTIRDTVNRYHIKKHYEASHRNINPNGIVSIGPELDYMAPHGREMM